MKKQLTWMLLLVAGTSFAQTGASLNLEVVSTGQTNVTSIGHCGDNRVFVTLQSGIIRFFNPYDGGSGTFMDIQGQVNDAGNERGLLGLAFAPDYEQSGHFYVNYTATGGATRISRFSVSAGDPNVADPASEQILLTITQPFSNHNGGDIKFGPDGYLYIGMGDGGSGGDPDNYSQNRQSLLGKMLRIDVSGGGAYSVPASNPFVGDNDPNNLVLDEIWALGVRNPWRFSFDRLTGDMWMGDVGQNVQEEVNFQRASSAGGENYGWRCYEGAQAFNTNGCQGAPNYVFPVFTYNHSTPNGCSITGGFVYRGLLNSQLYGRYLVTDYCSGRIWSVFEEEPNFFTSLDHGQYNTFQYTTFGEDQYGEMYLGRQNGQILRITINNSSPVAFISADETFVCEGQTVTLNAGFHPSLTYQWIKDGEDISGATNVTYEASESGVYQVRVINEDQLSTTSAEITLDVAPAPPVLTASADVSTICEDQGFAVSLNGSPAGGTFSGVGVQDNTFNPFELGAGIFPITYSFTSADGCESEPVTFNIEVRALPNAEILGVDESYCVETDIAVIPELVPPGGDFYGDGVSDGGFSPSSAGVGTAVLNYTYADAFGCGITVSFSTEVESCLGLSSAAKASEPLVYPNPAGNQISFRLAADEKLLVFKLYSLAGALVYECDADCHQGNSSIDLQGAVAVGSYLAEIQTNQGLYKQQLIKK